LKIWQLSCVVGALTALIVAGIWQLASERPAMAATLPSARIDAAFSAVSLNTTTILAKFSPANDARADDNSAKYTPATYSLASVPQPPRHTLAPNTLVAEAFKAAWPDALSTNADQAELSHGRVLAYADTTGSIPPIQDDAPAFTSIHTDRAPATAGPPAPAGSTAWANQELPYLKYYVYSELPPPKKPSVIALAALSDVPLGTPVDEIKRAADSFGLDPNFLKAVAKIESDFNPKDRTGSYIGLFQLSKREFNHFGAGSGEITNARDNAIAAAYKFVIEAEMFEYVTHKKPTIADLYLIHQQGWQGAAEHISHPDWVAWRSMCATDEGRQKGERWCKKAIWGNTLPAVKKEWKSVDRLTSAGFVQMWRSRIDTLYARYADAGTVQAQQ
jgi:transglycosylase-like protein with SLT domain